MKDRIIENLTVFQRGQSGWRFRSIVSLNVFTAEYKPLKRSPYIPLPSGTCEVQDSNFDIQGETWSSGLPRLARNRLPAGENFAIIGQWTSIPATHIL